MCNPEYINHCQIAINIQDASVQGLAKRAKFPCKGGWVDGGM